VAQRLPGSTLAPAALQELCEAPTRLLGAIRFSAAHNADEIGYDFVWRGDRLLAVRPGLDRLANDFGCGESLAAGDSLSFRGDVAHGPETLDKVPIRMLSIMIYDEDT